jgi:glycosyltransferase involved in cell wall biosynthesis
MRLSLVIPIYNEEELLPTVLKRVRAMGDGQPFELELVLVDDCSHDRTPEILEAEAERPGTIVCRHEKNRGKGAAIRTGLRRTTGEVIIVQDADMEYDPDDIPKLVEPIFAGRAKVVYGSRFLGTATGMRLPNRVANWLLAWMVSLLYGQRVTDEATAYKAFRRDVLQGIHLRCERFEFCPEVTAKVLRRGHRIHELPVTFFARTFEEGKKIGWRDFFEAVGTLVWCRFGKVDDGEAVLEEEAGRGGS